MPRVALERLARASSVMLISSVQLKHSPASTPLQSSRELVVGLPMRWLKAGPGTRVLDVGVAKNHSGLLGFWVTLLCGCWWMLKL